MKLKFLIICICFFTLCLPQASYAGEWKEDGGKYWYKEVDGSRPSATWKEIEGKWYYFTQDAYRLENVWFENYYLSKDGSMLKNTISPDGYRLKVDGEWDGAGKRIVTNKKFTMRGEEVFSEEDKKAYYLTLYEPLLAEMRNINSEHSGNMYTDFMDDSTLWDFVFDSSDNFVKWSYDLKDINNNGSYELILFEGDGSKYPHAIFRIKDGKPDVVISEGYRGGLSDLYSDGVFSVFIEGSMADAYTFYKLDQNDEEEYLDIFTDNKTWRAYYKGEREYGDGSIVFLTETEFDDAIESYTSKGSMQFEPKEIVVYYRENWELYAVDEYSVEPVEEETALSESNMTTDSYVADSDSRSNLGEKIGNIVKKWNLIGGKPEEVKKAYYLSLYNPVFDEMREINNKNRSKEYTNFMDAYLNWSSIDGKLEWSYALVDINKNGTYELLIRERRNGEFGSLVALFTIKDSKPYLLTATDITDIYNVSYLDVFRDGTIYMSCYEGTTKQKYIKLDSNDEMVIDTTIESSLGEGLNLEYLLCEFGEYNNCREITRDELSAIEMNDTQRYINYEYEVVVIQNITKY